MSEPQVKPEAEMPMHSYECTGCGAETFGKMPGRCIHCGGSHFVNPLDGKRSFRAVAAEVRALGREAGRLRGVIKGLRHRRYLGIVAKLDAIQHASWKAAKLLVGTIDATRPPLPKASPMADPAPVSQLGESENLPGQTGNESG